MGQPESVFLDLSIIFGFERNGPLDTRLTAVAPWVYFYLYPFSTVSFTLSLTTLYVVLDNAQGGINDHLTTPQVKYYGQGKYMAQKKNELVSQRLVCLHS